MSLSARRFQPQPRKWSRQCSGKVRYRDMADADRYARKREQEIGHRRLHSYPCDGPNGCGGWHIAKGAS